MSKKELTKQIADLALQAGLRVFIAGSGTYGLITDGEIVMCYSCSMQLTPTFSGNYNPVKSVDGRHIGTGWRIDECFPDNKLDILQLFEKAKMAPRWAVKNYPYKLTTLDQHLACYQRSSNYTEYFGAES